MSQELETALAAIMERLEQQEKRNQETNDLSKARDDSTKWMDWIKGLIGLLVLLVGLGINWGISKTKIEVLETKIDAVERTMDARIMKVEEDVHELQIKQASNDPVITQIQKDVTEIKADVKKLADGGTK